MSLTGGAQEMDGAMQNGAHLMEQAMTRAIDRFGNVEVDVTAPTPAPPPNTSSRNLM
ncbi:hypothetical protein [Pseudophaeobacter sp.]|uniref:hypothetical protein n=1 Tax=Pseudophaeobacter sp. TaxID=1971739 RepID=UPI00329A5BBC